MSEKRTLFEKVWDEHVVTAPTGRLPLLYIDLHLVHEVTSPQAFDGLRAAGRKVRQPHRTVATVDHNVPTTPRGTPIADPIAARQIQALQKNCKEFGVPLFDMDSAGHVIEYAGEAVRALSMEGRMTLCNMSIEAGARAGMVAPDETTFAYVKGRRFAPKEWEQASAHWRSLASDPGARYDKVVEIDASKLAPFVTWGTNPGMVVPVNGRVPQLNELKSYGEREAAQRMLEYMGLQLGTPMQKIAVERVFIGSCTNSRLEDLRAAARVARGYRVNPKVRAMVVPGSQTVKREAEQEGLDRVFQEAGFEWRESGCSMCLGMNPDILQPGERCASTSNRNFEGRQGRGGRTHLVSPMMAVAAAITGHFTDIREWKFLH